jgi:para-nitrobenzyl esterase
MIHWDYQPGGMGEDCLVLNVWTPGLKDGAKRPVLVSFHGGGFATGSGNALGFDGAQLARFGDVVVVTVNHRLAALGYLHLADLGAPPEFAGAGAAGNHGSHRVARMGARQHRELRRRSSQRDDLRSSPAAVRRRLLC